MVRYPFLVLSFTQAHLCDAPLCNVSHDNCAIPHKNELEILLQGIAAGPLSLRGKLALKSPKLALKQAGQEPPLDAHHPSMPRNPLTRGIPESINSWAKESLNRGAPELRLTIPVGSAQGAFNRGIPQLRNLWIEEFLGSGVHGHPTVVSIQGWFLAGPT